VKLKRTYAFLAAAAMCFCMPAYTVSPVTVYAGYEYSGTECAPAHDTSRNVQAEGVGNPFKFGERNTPENASAAEIRAINHKMTVQEVKYALYKEIDEHWELISTRLGQSEREKVYALFLGLGTRESTLGGNGDGADIETAFSEGFGVSSAHAYGTLQTAVTAFADCNPTFMKEDNVPEMYQYTFNESNFYDAIISNHMGIRKILHFAEICINQEHLTGYHVIRNSLKGFNTGWSNKVDDDGAYRTYADEICSMAQFYYNDGHLYDNIFTWTGSEAAAPYRNADRWKWWGDGVPSMAEVGNGSQPAATSSTETTTVTSTTSSTTSTTSTVSSSSYNGNIIYGDSNCDGKIDLSDAVLIMQTMSNPSKYSLSEQGRRNADCSGSNDGVTNGDALAIQKYMLRLIASLPETK